MPKVYLASDHAGFELKGTLVAYLRTLGYAVTDMGASTFAPGDDYPDYITPCAQKVAQENAHSAVAQAFGIILGGSGQGEAMAANRVSGARAAVFYGLAHVSAALDTANPGDDGYAIVRLAREHNDANLLSLGARFLKEEEAKEAVRFFLETPFSGDARHQRRLAEF